MLKKGESGPLNVTQQAHHRVFVGLGWDPKEKAKFADKINALIGGKKTYHDLDLLCFVFDQNKTCLAQIGAKSDHSLEDIGQIYHSGDNVEGLGDGDDEQISVELKNLAPNIGAIVFLVKVHSGHSFDEILSPEIRLADGYSDHNFLKYTFDSKDSAGSSAFAFCAIKRSEDGWDMKNMSEYMSEPNTKDWEAALAELI